MRLAVFSIVLAFMQNPPTKAIVDTPSVKVLKGLTVPEFEAEMQLITGDLRPKSTP